MGRVKAERIEHWVDRFAAALFAAAIAFAALRLAMPRGRWSWALALGAGMIGYLACARTLRAVRPEDRRFAVAEFEVADLALEPGELLLTEPVELLLTAADRLQPDETHAPDELVLEDILAKLGPDSRVVRLFDPAAMPTPGQLNARIERHLNGDATVCPDASEALYDALAELRRSLR